MELLREEAARGTAVAVTLHDLALAARYCDEVLVLDAVKWRRQERRARR